MMSRLWHALLFYCLAVLVTASDVAPRTFWVHPVTDVQLQSVRMNQHQPSLESMLLFGLEDSEKTALVYEELVRRNASLTDSITWRKANYLPLDGYWVLQQKEYIALCPLVMAFDLGDAIGDPPISAEFLVMLDRLLGLIRAFHLQTARLLGTPLIEHKFVVRCLSGNVPSFVFDLKHLDRLEIQSRHQVADRRRDGRIRWPALRELKIQQDDVHLDSWLPGTLLRFETCVGNEDDLRLLQLPFMLDTLDVELKRGGTVLSATDARLPPNISRLRINSKNLQLLQAESLYRLRHLHIQSEAEMLIFKNLYLNQEVTKQLVSLHLTLRRGHLKALPSTLAERFQHLEEFRLKITSSEEDRIKITAGKLPRSLQILELANVELSPQFHLTRHLKLRKLILNDCKLRSLANIMPPPNVEDVNLDRNPLTTLRVSGICRLPDTLRHLSLNQTDIRGIGAGDLPIGIKSLVLPSALRIVDLSTYTRLMTIDFYTCSDFKLSAARFPSSLQDLNLYGAPQAVRIVNPTPGLQRIVIQNHVEMLNGLDLSGAGNLKYAALFVRGWTIQTSSPSLQFPTSLEFLHVYSSDHATLATILPAIQSHPELRILKDGAGSLKPLDFGKLPGRPFFIMNKQNDLISQWARFGIIEAVALMSARLRREQLQKEAFDRGLPQACVSKLGEPFWHHVTDFIDIRLERQRGDLYERVSKVREDRGTIHAAGHIRRFHNEPYEDATAMSGATILHLLRGGFQPQPDVQYKSTRLYTLMHDMEPEVRRYITRYLKLHQDIDREELLFSRFAW